MSELIQNLPTNPHEHATPKELAMVQPLLENYDHIKAQISPLKKYLIMAIVFIIFSFPFINTFIQGFFAPGSIIVPLLLKTAVFIAILYIVENYI
jgi:hypothetical protein